MVESVFIATFCAVFATETTKNLAKEGANTLYERATNLFKNELITLNLNGDETYEEVQEKLLGNSVVKDNIEKKFQENKELFDALSEFLKENPNTKTNIFNSRDNEKVINIGENHGKIDM